MQTIKMKNFMVKNHVIRADGIPDRLYGCFDIFLFVRYFLVEIARNNYDACGCYAHWTLCDSFV